MDWVSAPGSWARAGSYVYWKLGAKSTSRSLQAVLDLTCRNGRGKRRRDAGQMAGRWAGIGEGKVTK